MYFTHQGEGAYWPAGTVNRTGAGPVHVTVSAADPNGLQDLLGVTRRVWLGALAASPADAPRRVPLAGACGLYLDHYLPH
jgi:hypothetical protein